MVWVVWFGVYDLGDMVEGVWLRFGCMNDGVWFWVHGLVCRVQGV